jgi:hypothetical protein
MKKKKNKIGEWIKYKVGNDTYYSSRGCKDGCGLPIAELPVLFQRKKNG